MKVFKFGGASVKDAPAVRNVTNVLKEVGHQDTLVVISAMGKTTNALEKVVNAYFEDKAALAPSLQEVITYHEKIIADLFEDPAHPLHKTVALLFEELKGFLAWNKSPNHPFVYDQVIGYGELVSTTILSTYLNAVGLSNTWLDARNLIKTDSTYREGQVDWQRTQHEVDTQVNTSKLNIVQGFIASDDNNFTTTLGREGSDYTAAILAYCLNAESVTIWKDVPGVLNADPRHFEKTQLLHQISYTEAIELAFYGASVIHPKTLQPLQKKEIPLYVKFFMKPTDPGTTISQGEDISPKIPCFIVKKDQVLLKLSSLDFSFMMENNISEIFKLFHDYQVKVGLIQNSAISFSVCLEDKFRNLQALLSTLQQKFKVVCHENVDLYTIRHFDDSALPTLQKGKTILVEQRSKETLQLVVK